LLSYIQSVGEISVGATPVAELSVGNQYIWQVPIYLELNKLTKEIETQHGSYT
jgi:hypothetical protein